jgi:ABC-type branched-subunit amino acid transport system substrate-binding protein
MGGEYTSRVRRLSLVALLFAACPHSFNPGGTIHAPKGSSAEAKRAFDDAQALFARSDFETAAQQFTDLVTHFPEDPVVPYARFYAARADEESGKYDTSVPELEHLAGDTATPDDLRPRVKFWLGVGDAYLGHWQEAHDLLAPVADGTTGDDKAEACAALAEASAGLGDVPSALRWYDAFFAIARPAERTYVAARVAQLVGGLDDAGVRRAYDKADRKGPVAAYAGLRLASILRTSGDESGARKVVDDTESARAAVGMQGPAGGGAGDAGIVGAILPLTRARHLIGERVLRGVAVAGGTFDRGQGTFRIEVRDDGDGHAGAAVDELAALGAIAIVGPVDPTEIADAAPRAEAAGLPMVTVNPAEDAQPAGPHVFKLVVPAETRARSLADWASAQGYRSFAILAPDMAYGTRVADAFADEVQKNGGQIAARVAYTKGATSFVGPVGQIAGKSWDAVFVPDSADELELIAPQLAVADLVVRPAGDKKKPHKGRAIRLLSTAEGLAPKFLAGSGRYTEGAVFAPGFYPDDADPVIGPYVARFLAAYGEPPTAFDAYAYDAATVVRAVVDGGAGDRATVTQGLEAIAPAHPIPGLSGGISFAPTHARADSGLLFNVVADGQAFAIHSLRQN